MIFLDNSSTTHKKPRCVISGYKKGLTSLSVNAGRGGYDLAVEAGMEVLNVRTRLADMFNTRPEDVVFTGSCTQALNLGLRGYIKPNGHIVATVLEHNSVLRTLEYLKNKYNISYTLVKPTKHIIHAKDIEDAITPKTHLVCCIHTSNVTGATNNIEEIGKVCKKHSCKFLVDCAQSGGHIKVDMVKCNINMVTVAGHKGFYAPQGIGVLLKRDIDITPLIYGGTGTHSESLSQPNESPEGLESGTLSMPNILALGKGVEYVEKHFDRLNHKMHKMTTKLIDYLKTNRNVILYSYNTHSGIASINIKGKDSTEVSDILNEKYQICVRSGLHCAPKLHEYYNTLTRGMVRISISPFNKMNEIKKCIKAIDEISKK